MGIKLGGRGSWEGGREGRGEGGWGGERGEEGGARLWVGRRRSERTNVRGQAERYSSNINGSREGRRSARLLNVDRSYECHIGCGSQ